MFHWGKQTVSTASYAKCPSLFQSIQIFKSKLGHNGALQTKFQLRKLYSAVHQLVSSIPQAKMAWRLGTLIGLLVTNLMPQNDQNWSVSRVTGTSKHLVFMQVLFQTTFDADAGPESLSALSLSQAARVSKSALAYESFIFASRYLMEPDIFCASNIVQFQYHQQMFFNQFQLFKISITLFFFLVHGIYLILMICPAAHIPVSLCMLY